MIKLGEKKKHADLPCYNQPPLYPTNLNPMSHISYPHPQRETVNSSSIEVIRSLSVLAMAVAFDSWRWAYVTRAAGCQMLPDFFSGWWFEAL